MRFKPTTILLGAVILGLALGVMKFIGEHPRRPAGFDQLRGLSAISKSDPWDKKWRLMSEQAVMDSWNNYGVPLDYSDKSIQTLDAELDRIYRSAEFRAASDKDQRAEGVIFGAYLGEVICRNHGGAWGEESNEEAQLFSFPVKFGKDVVFPANWCYKRLENGPEDNIWLKYKYFVLGQTNGMEYSITIESNLSTNLESNGISTNREP
jgi:hypothetical protein